MMVKNYQLGFPLSSQSGYYNDSIVEFCDSQIWVKGINHHVNIEKKKPFNVESPENLK